MAQVSVIIPCYNSEQFLDETLASVLGQSFADVEIVIVDDGSVDGTRGIINRLKDPRVVRVFQENRGVGEARNAGIARSRGTYLAFLDHDDLWEPDKLVRQVALLDAHPKAGLVYSDCLVIDTAGRVSKRFSDDYRLWRGRVFEALLRDNFVPLSTVVMRRSVFDEVGPFLPYSIVEDYDLLLKCAMRYVFDFLPEPLARYRRHPGNFSRNLERAGAELSRVYDDLLVREPWARYQILKGKSRNFYLMGKTALYDGRPRDAIRLLEESVRTRIAPAALAYLVLARCARCGPVQRSLLGARRVVKRAT